MKLYTLSLATAMVLFSGCTARLADPEISFAPPKYVEEMPAMVDEQNYANQGSIFGKGENPLYADHKAMKINDIVTVVINESATSANSAQKALAESDAVNLGAGVFTNVGANGGAGAANGMVDGAIGTLNGYTNIGFGTNSDSSYSGSGSLQKSNTLTTTLAARVVKVLENGNLYIYGSREIMVDEDKQVLMVSGVIRTYDISQDNQINSSQISDARIAYMSKGDIDRATEQGWGTKLIQSTWPF